MLDFSLPFALLGITINFGVNRTSSLHQTNVHIYIFLRPILVYVSMCGSGKRKIDMFSQENVNDK